MVIVMDEQDKKIILKMYMDYIHTDPVNDYPMRYLKMVLLRKRLLACNVDEDEESEADERDDDSFDIEIVNEDGHVNRIYKHEIDYILNGSITNYGTGEDDGDDFANGVEKNSDESSICSSDSYDADIEKTTDDSYDDDSGSSDEDFDNSDSTESGIFDDQSSSTDDFN